MKPIFKTKVERLMNKRENLKLAIYLLLLGLTQNREKKSEKSVNKTNIEILNSIFKFKNYYQNNFRKSFGKGWKA